MGEGGADAGEERGLLQATSDITPVPTPATRKLFSGRGWGTEQWQ